MPSPDYAFVQYHGQAASSTLHQNLTAMWAAISADTGGRVTATVHAENGKVAGGDPTALRMLIAGEIQFYTLMGGILGTVVPVAEVQQVPFAFASAEQAHKAIDGPLGAMLGAEMAAKGMHLFPQGGFDNGMRQIASVTRAVATPDDLAGMKIRVPAGQLIFDTFKAFGAEPIVIPAYQLYDGLASGRVTSQENPLAVLEGFKLYELVKYVSMTNHMWSGFNLMAHLPTWQRLPHEIKGVIERRVVAHVRRQRMDQTVQNTSLRQDLARRGLMFNEVDQGAFRARLGEIYSTWREKLGMRCWSLLEAEVGTLR
ncbi:MAG: TRAP transporter substrate-binding protein [Xanthobacteraceae bacterium]|nr:TRAP transporter substrate-binding protein [Xanthobacteraceae bacterium]